MHLCHTNKAMNKTPDKIYITGYSSIGGDRDVDPVWGVGSLVVTEPNYALQVCGLQLQVYVLGKLGIQVLCIKNFGYVLEEGLALLTLGNSFYKGIYSYLQIYYFPFLIFFGAYLAPIYFLAH